MSRLDTPQTKCRFGEKVQGLNFLGINVHHKPAGTRRGPKYNLDPAVYNVQLLDIATAINAQNDAFVAIPGIE